MANMSPEKVKMNEQAPDIRNKNFLEVSLGYTPEQAMEEAKRCLNCKNMPCVSGCPVNVRIPEFISYIANGEFEKAYLTITDTNALPAVCGRVCPQENQCEGKCVRGIKGESVGIGRLERFAADCYGENVKKEVDTPVLNGKTVAVVGGAPASLICAGALAYIGYSATIVDAFHTPGGVLWYGSPEF